MEKLEVISYQLHMLIEYKMYLCVSYIRAQSGVFRQRLLVNTLNYNNYYYYNYYC